MTKARRTKGQRSGGVDVDADHVSVGRDVAGRDIVHVDDRDVIQVGYSEKAVLRLVLAVGALVFATAACFFGLGAFVVGNSLAAFDRNPRNAAGVEVNSSIEAGRRFEQNLQAAQSGQSPALAFTEDELSSYVKFIAGPELGLTDGKARFVGDGRVAISGRLQRLGNLHTSATFALQTRADRVAQLESAAVEILPTGSAFGWVVVPNFLLQSFADDIDARLRGIVVTGAQWWNDWQWGLTVETK